MNKPRKGFSLVEALLIISIIGILCAIGIPAFMEHRNADLLREVQKNHPEAMLLISAKRNAAGRMVVTVQNKDNTTSTYTLPRNK